MYYPLALPRYPVNNSMRKISDMGADDFAKEEYGHQHLVYQLNYDFYIARFHMVHEIESIPCITARTGSKPVVLNNRIWNCQAE